uniref:Uncharacterized protein n=1 Tax=Kalanchoe fedtschenkoi TaxID=63787 RepID=A0A7N0UYX8_KALFE
MYPVKKVYSYMQFSNFVTKLEWRMYNSQSPSLSDSEYENHGDTYVEEQSDSDLSDSSGQASIVKKILILMMIWVHHRLQIWMNLHCLK